MIKEQLWIGTELVKSPGPCPVFIKTFDAKFPKKATIEITAKGVYYAELNKNRVGNFVMAPGYTEYSMRHPYQIYDITDFIKDGKNTLEVTLSSGWYAGRCTGPGDKWTPEIIAEITLEYDDGRKTIIGTDETWLTGFGPLEFSDIYDGEIFDGRKEIENLIPVMVNKEASKDMLILQDGENVIEQECFITQRIFKTPKGETVIDFGQNFTGYPVFTVDAKSGEEICVSFAEVLDKDGNFYNENYRTAKCYYKYICKDGIQSFRPRCTFYGFRYIRLDKFPESAKLDENTFKGVAVYSDIKEKGHLSCSDSKLNQLFSNVFWGQKSNFLDIPTDCPQRDERFGWTGDAQIFCKAASYNYDTLKFYRKWLRDMDALRKRIGYVGFTVPGRPSPIAAAWTDAAVIIPWQIYSTYGDITILEEMIDTMVSHVEFIAKESEYPFTWRGGKKLRQFGDWLATDSPDRDNDGNFISTSYSGATDPNFLQAAFYANDVAIVAKALELLEKDSSYYKELYKKIIKQFQEDFPVYKTQTECAIALRFNLTPDRNATISQLAEMIHKNNDCMTTGLVGTPHILHALSENGHTDIAYTLLLQEKFPSWLFSVNLGATTMWEHWDGINEAGEFWNPRMNSFNHYSYGAVADWVYEVAAGITQEKDSCGFKNPVIEPHPDKRLNWLEASLKTDNGIISSKWIYTIENCIRYEITVPTASRIIINGKSKNVEKGTYIFFSDL